MAVTFHAPPAWPAPPEGFIPPADWQPDPAWGPAPAQWTFYTDGGVAVPAPTGSWQPPVASLSAEGVTASMQTPSPVTPPPPTETPQPAAPSAGPGSPPSGIPAPPPGPVPPGAPTTGPQPTFGAAGAMPPGAMPMSAPPKKKSRVGLIIGLVVGGFVIVVILAVVAFLVLLKPANSGPELTAAQFNTMFPEGESILDRTIDYRTTEEPAGATSTNTCSLAITSALRAGTEHVSAVTDDQELYFLASRFGDKETATSQYERVNNACENSGSGSVNGARWISLDFTDSDGALTLYGNTLVFGAAEEGVTMDMSDIAAAAQSEVESASKG